VNIPRQRNPRPSRGIMPRRLVDRWRRKAALTLLSAVFLALSGGPSIVRAAGAEDPLAGSADSTVVSIELTGQSPLRDFFRLAAWNNPGLKASYENWMALASLAAKEGGWPDPVISWSYYIESVETAVGPQQHRLALSQAIPWFGKLSAKGSAAEQAALAAESEYRAARLALFSRVAVAYYEYAYLAEAITFTRENLELMKYQESVARSRYRTNQAAYSDLIKAQVELGTLEDRLKTLQDRRLALAAHLNETLGREADAPLPWPVSLQQPDFPAPEREAVQSALLAENPELESFKYKLASVDERIRVARKDGYPDFMVGIQTILTGPSDLTAFPGQGKDAWIATLSMKIPLWRGKYNGGVESAIARRRQIEHAREDERLRLLARGEDLLFRLQDAERRINLYGESLLPKARQSLKATATAYQTGDATFLDFLDAQRTLLRFELDHSRARADRGQQIVQLAALMGTALDEGGGHPDPSAGGKLGENQQTGTQPGDHDDAPAPDEGDLR